MGNFRPDYLTACTVYKLTNMEPTFLEHMEEGNVAYYGLILQSEYDEQIKEYLLKCAKDGLWEYQHDYGVTAEDSALVIEGLLESGADREILRASVRKLVQAYYSESDGAFKIVLEGRARYWRGVSTETTAHIAYLLYRITPEEHSREIMSCASYIRKTQKRDGSWTGKWFPSIMIPTFYSIRLLCIIGESSSRNVTMARDYMIQTQHRNGSWNSSVIDSSAAIMGLCCADGPLDIIERGRDWLLSRKGVEGWEGEPVLYYWFEEEDVRLFHCCRDKGRITTAWAMLALKTSANIRVHGFLGT
jgi:hypothetical protein